MSTSSDPAVEEPIETTWWYGVIVPILVLGGLGVYLPSAGLVLCAGVALVLAGYARIDADPPKPDVLALDRDVDEATRAGEHIEVIVEIRNTSNRAIPDLRIVDGVPDAIEVTHGTAKHATALRPGEEISFSYSVEALRGTHEWDPVTGVLANRSNSRVRPFSVELSSSVECRHPPIETRSLPVRELTTSFEGRVRTERGGSGTTFFALRDYRQGDPLRRINWYRLAKTGELGTIEFQEQRGVSVVLLIDARKIAYRAPQPSTPHAVDRSVEAATRIFSSLLQQGHRGGIAVFGTVNAWLPPGTGTNHHAHAIELLTNHPSLSQDPPDREPIHNLLDERRDELLEERVKKLHHRLPPDAQVFCLSPCVDEFMASVADYLDAHGHSVTVISPNPTATDTPGHVIAALAREHRLRQLFRYGIPIINWRPDESLEVALHRREVVQRT